MKIAVRRFSIRQHLDFQELLCGGMSQGFEYSFCCNPARIDRGRSDRCDLSGCDPEKVGTLGDAP